MQNLDQLIETLHLMKPRLEPFQKCLEILETCLAGDSKVLVCGNGGSASQSSHFTGEMLWRLQAKRRPFPVINLCADPSVTTAISNDSDFNEVFSVQVRGLGKQGDVLLALSTSGKSKNILNAIESAHQLGMKTILLTGKASPPIPVDCCVNVPSSNVQRIQEIHLLLLHSICQYLEEKLT